MPLELILRIPRSDQEGEYVLVNVTSNGPAPLDLRLLATEGLSPYISNIKQSRIHKFRAKSSHLNNEQWEALLHSILLRQSSHGKLAEKDALTTLETSATISDDQLVIIFRKNISGITQRLGEIALHKDEDLEIDSISWAGTAVARTTELEKEIDDLQGKYEDQGKAIKKLDRQLEDLIEAKIEQENDLLVKFRDLLNAKKSKIRDLHRLLAGAKLDPGKAATLQSEHESINPRKPTASRPSKRKAKGAPPHPAVGRAVSTASTSDEEAESHEMMSIDNDDDNDPRPPKTLTPERSDHSLTETDDDDNDLDSVPISQPSRRHSHETTATKAPARVLTPPPPRKLPFAQARQGAADEGAVNVETRQKSQGRPAVATIDDEEETSDDEL